MSELSPLNDVVADDLLLDRIRTGAVDHPEPVAVLLGALAAHAAAPLQPVRAGRRSRRHRFLSGLAVLAVGASGAGVAAAVTQPNVRGGLPDDALSVRPPAVHRVLPPRELPGTSALTEVRLSAIAYAASGPLSPSWDAAPVLAPSTARAASPAGGPASATNLPQAGATGSTPAAGSATSDPVPAGDGGGTGNVSNPAGPADSPALEATSPPATGTQQPQGTESAAGDTSSSSSSAGSDPAQGPASDPGAPVPSPDPSQEPTTETSNGAGNGREVAPGPGGQPTTQLGRGFGPGKAKKQQPADAVPPGGPALVTQRPNAQTAGTVGPAAVGRGGVLPAQACPLCTQDASAVTTVTPAAQTD
jgi:hypothetical protein